MFGRSLTTTSLVFGLATSAFAQASGGATVTGTSEGAASNSTTLPGVTGPADSSSEAGTANGTAAGAAVSNCGVETSMHGTGTAGSAGVADIGAAGTAGSAGASGSTGTVDAC